MENEGSKIKAPPIPTSIEEDVDAKTVPANAAWEVTPDTERQENGSLDDPAYPYGDVPGSHSTQSATAGNGPTGPVLPSKTHQTERKLSISGTWFITWFNSKAAIAASAAILVLAFFVLLNRTHTPKPIVPESTRQSTIERSLPNQPTPDPPSLMSADPIVVKDPIVMPVEVPFNQLAYLEAKKAIEQILAEMAGPQGKDLGNPGEYQPLETLFEQIATKSDGNTLSNILGGILEQEIKAQPVGAVIPWDRLWTLGITLFHAASVEIDTVERDFLRYRNPEIKADLARYRKWLSTWVLGKRGVYCQVHQRFLQQVKIDNPAILKKQQIRISEIKQERERHLEKLGQPLTDLNEFCAKPTLDT